MKKLKYILVIMILLTINSNVYAKSYNNYDSLNNNNEINQNLFLSNNIITKNINNIVNKNTLFMVNTNIPKFCEQAGVKKALRFIGYLLFVAKIVVPILLIVFGSIDFGKTVIASNQDAIYKAAKSFGIRIVAGIVIFILPTIINFTFDLLPSPEGNFTKCTKCVFKPNKCNIPK